MRILTPDTAHRQPSKSTLSVHLPSALAGRVARPGPPWRGFHCCPSPSSGAAAPDPWNLCRDKTDQPQALQAYLSLHAPASHCSHITNRRHQKLISETPKAHLGETWLGAETSGVPRAPTVAPQPQITHLFLKLGGTSSTNGDILIYSLIPESSEA